MNPLYNGYISFYIEMKLVVELKNAALKSDVYTLRCVPGVYPGAAFQHF